MDEKRQVQKELFDEFTPSQKRRQPRNAFNPKPKKVFTLFFEHLVLVSIGVIMIAVVAFSLGVEKGKRIAKKEGYDISVSVNGVNEKASSKEVEHVEAAPVEVIEKPQVQLPERYTIQVASFVKKEIADKEASLLKAQGFDGFVLEKGKYSILCIGRFASRDNASKEQKLLRKKYSDCLIRKIN